MYGKNRSGNTPNNLQEYLIKNVLPKIFSGGAELKMVLHDVFY